MSSSKKALIKQAKEALASKQWKEALTTLKAVLQDDKNCYEALV